MSRFALPGLTLSEGPVSDGQEATSTLQRWVTPLRQESRPQGRPKALYSGCWKSTAQFHWMCGRLVVKPALRTALQVARASNVVSFRIHGIAVLMLASRASFTGSSKISKTVKMTCTQSVQGNIENELMNALIRKGEFFDSSSRDKLCEIVPVRSREEKRSKCSNA